MLLKLYTQLYNHIGTYLILNYVLLMDINILKIIGMYVIPI